ncbi:MAG: ATP-dependent DNA ligase [Chloroflexota bacterium]
MLYQRLVDGYERISETTKRTEMASILVELLRETPPSLVHQVVYLTQGKLYPEFVPVEMRMAERLTLKAVAEATGVSEEEVSASLASSGDLGITAERLLQQTHAPSPRLSVEEVYRRLDEIARTTGKGSVTRKIELLAGLLRQATPGEARYLIRTVTGKLRLGLADMTILDALSIAYGGGKGARAELERAYNLCSDLGEVATAVATGGVQAVRGFRLQPGKPIRPMLAQRLRSPEEILGKLAGRCEAEYKYDGERLQAHKMGDRVVLFSRRLEDTTEQYPDAARFIREQVKAREAILEAEAVAMNPETGELRPFQELMHRRRRYGIQKAVAEYPVVLYAFDLIYRDGRDLTSLPFPERRLALEAVIATSTTLQPIPARVVDSQEGLEGFFQEAIEAGCEGLVCKSLKPDSVYEAGNRGWNWIKYKREYVSEMTDTVDLVVVGALHGRGKRGGGYGALLLSVYDPETDSFPTVTKCGTGFTDRDLAELPSRLEPYRIDHRHPRVDARMKADVWFVPALVLEVLGAEITLSPIHTTDWGTVRPDTGLAIRFPRFTGRYRPDKAPEDATTDDEILQMYHSRLHKVRQ